MRVQNTTYSNHSIAVGDHLMLELITLMRTDYSGLFQTTSVVLDFIASLFATFFIYRFYLCIEISHPLYAVIFMDLVISTATSYLASTLILVDSIVKQFFYLLRIIPILGSPIVRLKQQWVVIQISI